MPATRDTNRAGNVVPNADGFDLLAVIPTHINLDFEFNKFNAKCEEKYESEQTQSMTISIDPFIYGNHSLGSRPKGIAPILFNKP
mmetsp:Transcript_38305/g.89093  ORF Transcript_38305/g.89093 Transcript_38305/m.89093 type:complete len:85 (+) Transcript_38305:865-1119(+)